MMWVESPANSMFNQVRVGASPDQVNLAETPYFEHYDRAVVSRRDMLGS
jgi:hypothetical protein